MFPKYFFFFLNQQMALGYMSYSLQFSFCEKAHVCRYTLVFKSLGLQLNGHTEHHTFWQTLNRGLDRNPLDETICNVLRCIYFETKFHINFMTVCFRYQHMLCQIHEKLRHKCKYIYANVSCSTHAYLFNGHNGAHSLIFVNPTWLSNNQLFINKRFRLGLPIMHRRHS